jgi:hypothetical protein
MCRMTRRAMSPIVELHLWKVFVTVVFRFYCIVTRMNVACRRRCCYCCYYYYYRTWNEISFNDKREKHQCSFDITKKNKKYSTDYSWHDISLTPSSLTFTSERLLYLFVFNWTMLMYLADEITMFASLIMTKKQQQSNKRETFRN